MAPPGSCSVAMTNFGGFLETRPQKKLLSPLPGAPPEQIGEVKLNLILFPVWIAEARPIEDRWTAEGFFGKRAAQSVQHLQDLHSQRSAEPRALPLCECHDRNGAEQ